MGLLSSRFMIFHRMVLLPPLVLLTLTCLYTSSTLSPFSSTHRLSFSQEVQCFSCESSSSFPSRSFLSLANFPASSYIRDIVLRHNVLNVEDSRGESTAEADPGSRLDTNEVQSFYGQTRNEKNEPGEVDGVSHWGTTRRVKEEVSLPEASARVVVPVEENPVEENRIVVPQVSVVENPVDETQDENRIVIPQASVAEYPVQLEKAEEEFPAQVEEPTNRSPSNEKPAEENKVDGSVDGDNAASTEERIDDSETKENLEESRTEDVDRFVPEGENRDSSVQAEELYSKTKDNSESNRNEDVHGFVPEDQNVVSTGNIVLPLETKENFEEDRKEVLQLENRHLTSDSHASPDEHVVLPIETNVTVAKSASAPPLEEVDVMRFGHENMSRKAEIAGIAVQKLMDAITRSGLSRESVNSSNAKDLDVNLLLRGGVPQGVPLPEERSCEGRHVFVYDLPSKFNYDLVGQCDTLLSWFDFCDYFMNEGMGTNVPTDELNDRGEKVLVPDGSWFLTHQYALELIFHARLKYYPCLTKDVNQADLFFVPYYAGLDVIRWHFQPNISNVQRDELTLDLMNWLEGQETWSRNKGVDHVFVLGKIGWDFRRYNAAAEWGSRLLILPEMHIPTKVLIERDPWHPNDVGVPHPTFFHPKDDNEIRTWLAHVEKSERRHLVSFAGMPRPKMKHNVRGHLIEQCLGHPDDCFLLRCVKTICMRPDSTMNLFLHSHFCMQPSGDSPTRRSVFDSLVGGCIPVLFDPYTAYYQYAWHLPQNASSYSVFIPSLDVMSGKSDIVEILKSITPEERTAMRMRIIREIIPGLLYSRPGTKHSDFRDAFDISIDALLNRVANLRAENNSI